jgi:putative CocE/NonD family hydrolase
MADGTRLATDVYLPAERTGDRTRGGFPTVLIRLPYDKTGEHAWIPDVAARLLSDGFAVVAQDTRGKARSEGRLEAFVHEAADGHATLDWIVDQPWSDGSVGMFGQSYFGYTQWAAASTGHPALRCIVPQTTASDIGAEWMYRDGVFQLQTMAEWAAWAWTDARMTVHEIDWTALPVSSLVERWTGTRSDSFETWVRHRPTSPWWPSLSPLQRTGARLRAAVMNVAGLWDPFVRGQLGDFARARARFPAVDVRVRVSATDHYGASWARPGAAQIDLEHDSALREEALDSYLGPAPAWYAAWLRDDGPAPGHEIVRFEVPGDGWRVSTSWPPDGHRLVELRLAADGRLAVAGGRPSHASIPFNPEEPVPTLDDNPWNPLLRPADRAALPGRGDVLAFDSEPMGIRTVVAGDARVSVTASARGGASTLHATLVDVWPDGTARRLAGGVALLGRDPVPVTLDLGPIAMTFDVGRVLRLELAASDFPRHPRAAGGASMLSAETLSPGEVVVVMDDDARLELPTLPV